MILFELEVIGDVPKGKSVVVVDSSHSVLQLRVSNGHSPGIFGMPFEVNWNRFVELRILGVNLQSAAADFSADDALDLGNVKDSLSVEPPVDHSFAFFKAPDHLVAVAIDNGGVVVKFFGVVEGREVLGQVFVHVLLLHVGDLLVRVDHVVDEVIRDIVDRYGVYIQKRLTLDSKNVEYRVYQEDLLFFYNIRL